MHKIATLELLSHRQVNLLANMRASQVQTSLKQLCETEVMEDMKQWFDDLTMNAFVRMVGGKRLVLQGHKRNMERIEKDLDHLIEEWLEDHKKKEEIGGG